MTQLLSSLLQCSLFLAVAGIVATILLRYVRLTSYQFHSWTWWLVLANGVMLTNISVAIPWHCASLTRDNAQSLRSVNTNEWRALDSQDVGDQPKHGISEGQVSRAGSQSSNWPTILFSVWGAGMAFFLFRWLINFSRFQQACRVQKCDNPQWSEQWNTLLEESGIKPAIPMYETPVLGPFLCRSAAGYQLVVPRCLWSSITEQQRDCILRHELAHYHRSDLWKSVAAHLLALPHWFNPMAWVAVRKLEECTEWACDDAARGAGGYSSANYAKVLLAICEHYSQRSAWAPAMSGGVLSRRIERIVTFQQKRDAPARQVLVATTMVALVLFQAVRVELVAQEPQPEPEFFDAHFTRSSLLAEMKDYHGAIAALTASLEARPKSYSALFNRGLYHQYIGDYDKAIADYTLALAEDADFSFHVGSPEECRAHAHHYRGRAFEWFKDDDAKAIVDYTEALRLDPAIERVLQRRAQAYHRVREFAKAHDDFQRLVGQDPYNVSVLSSWAWQLATCPDAKYRNGSLALDLLADIKDLDLDALAAAYAETGKYEEAIATQGRAIERLNRAPEPKSQKATEQRSKRLREKQERLTTYRARRPFRDE